jgi:hypothetical protein
MFHGKNRNCFGPVSASGESRALDAPKKNCSRLFRRFASHAHDNSTEQSQHARGIAQQSLGVLL